MKRLHFSLSKIFSLHTRNRKVVKIVRIGLIWEQWFAKSLEECLKGVVKQEFYSSSREENMSFIAQRCFNSRGRYMALVEYGNGGRRNFTHFGSFRQYRGEEDGRGFEGGRNRGWSIREPRAMVNHLKTRLYKEAILPCIAGTTAVVARVLAAQQ